MKKELKDEADKTLNSKMQQMQSKFDAENASIRKTQQDQEQKLQATRNHQHEHREHKKSKREHGHHLNKETKHHQLHAGQGHKIN